jgi:hypothetical protein
MPTPIERILAEWSRIATDLTRGGYDDPADALDAAITAALEAEREMREAWGMLQRPNFCVSASDDITGIWSHVRAAATLNRHLGGE